MATKGVVLVALCLAYSMAAQIDMETPYTIGNAGYGYSLAFEQGDGDVIVASNPVGPYQTIISKVPIGQSGEPSANQLQVPLTKNKGHVTCGCIATVNGEKMLFAGMSQSGYVSRVKLEAHADNPVAYLNATESELLWAGGPPQTLVSAVCKGQYVYFGTKSPDVSTYVVRLDTLDTNPSTRFRTLGPLAQGDLTQASEWGDNEVMFVMEPDNAIPLTFFVIKAGADWKLEQTIPAPTDLSNFDMLSGIAADYSTKRVVMANANGAGRVAIMDVSTPSLAAVEQMLVLEIQGMQPITSFVVDTDARYAYATVGDCSDDGATGTVAIRLAPQLTQTEFAASAAGVFNCTAVGTPSHALLIKTAGDTESAPAPRRQLLVFTEVDYSVADVAIRDGAVVPYQVLGAGPCPGDCHEADSQGECAGEKCYCYQAWEGSDCNTPAPCGGTGCSNHGTCTESGCDCEIGWSGVDCSTAVVCPEDCSGRGTCNQGVCSCNPGYTGVGCHLQTQGCESLADCNSHGTCVEGYPAGTCNCDTGYIGNDCSIVDTSCPGNCSGHGTCLAGECTCEDDYTGADCSQLVSACPNNCSAHGICRHNRCTCYHGFKGLDCSSVDRNYCANGCTGHGSCNNGICSCEVGWKGSDCSIAERDLRVASETILVAGENDATTSFVITVTANEVVFCVASTPGKCIAFDANTFTRSRDATFADDQAPTTMLLQSSEGVAPAKQPSRLSNALTPDFGQISSVALVELGAAMGDAPISVSVVDDSPNGYAILGTKLTGNGTMHGQLLKISLSTFVRSAELEFDDDNGRGVTAGCRGADGSLFFASGSNPAMIYRVNSELEILTRVSIDQAPMEEVSVLLYDGTRYLVAGSERTIYLYELVDGALTALSNTSALELPEEFGMITTGFIDTRGENPIAYFGTSSSPAAVVKVTLTASPHMESLRLNTGENHITSVTYHEDFAYFGLASDTATDTCNVVKMVVSAFREVDVVDLKNCSADLSSASVSSDGAYAYFGNAASPSHIYTIRLFSRNLCPKNCSGHGLCVQGTCSCAAGWMGDSCSTEVPHCPNNCSHAGSCVNHTCHCNVGHFGDDCSVIEICTEKCAHGHCAGRNSTWPCVCESEAWGGTYCSESRIYCPNECSNHGVCEHGACVCNPGYAGVDCSTEEYPPVSLRGCRIDADCGTHGVCEVSTTGTGKCKCAEGWTGVDCDIDEEFKEAVETSKISPAVIAVLVVAALLVGAIAGVSIWKSWAGNSAGGSSGVAGLNGGGGTGPSRVAAGGGYTRLPRRLVK